MNQAYQTARPLSPEQNSLVKNMLDEIGASQYKTVSFRLEDTLMILPFPEYYDLFLLMEDDFKMFYTASKHTFTFLRCEAEDAAEKAGISNIGTIYNILMKKAGITEKARDTLMARECELVTFFASPRSFGKQLFDRARHRKKRIAIVSDSIYPRSVIANIISHCGYDNCNELLLTRGSGKSAGEVIDLIMEKTHTSAGKLLHVGSSIENDVEAAILKGCKSLLITPVVPLMVKSGRLRGWVQSKKLFDYDTPQYLALHCAFGIYAAYAFDVPQNKQPHSDFCSDEYMLGFIVLGALSLTDFDDQGSDLRRTVKKALEDNPKCAAGAEDFRQIFRADFADFLDKFGYKGCDMPFEFLLLHSAVGDRMLLDRQLQPFEMQAWTDVNTEPDTAPVYGRQVSKSAAQKLADKMFPPGTKVRTIADNMLDAMKRKTFGGKKNSDQN